MANLRISSVFCGCFAEAEGGLVRTYVAVFEVLTIGFSERR